MLIHLIHHLEWCPETLNSMLFKVTEVISLILLLTNNSHRCYSVAHFRDLILLNHALKGIFAYFDSFESLISRLTEDKSLEESPLK